MSTLPNSLSDDPLVASGLVRPEAREAARELLGFDSGPRKLDLDWLEAAPERWLRELYPRYVRASFAPWLTTVWEWVWALRRGHKARSLIEIIFRGGAKSTSAELSVPAVAARRARSFALYLSHTQDQANKHVGNAKAAIESPGFALHYPECATRQLNKYGHSRGWNTAGFVTESGFACFAFGLDTAMRGYKIDEYRPDYFILDDLDSRHDSANQTAKKIELITDTILPAAAENYAVLGIQNLIHADSVFAQLHDKRAKFLVGARVEGPVPALLGEVEFAETEIPDPDLPGRMMDRIEIITGDPVWDGMDLARCNELVNDIGIPAFERECLHLVHAKREGLIYKTWDPRRHVVLWEDFAEYYGAYARALEDLEEGQHWSEARIRFPVHSTLARGQDWGTTVQHPCATGWYGRIGEVFGFDKDPLTDSFFRYRELVRPEYPIPASGKVAPVSVLRIARAIVAAERADNEDERMEVSTLSHEASTEQEAYRSDITEVDPPLPPILFDKNDAGAEGGIGAMQNYLECDPKKRHPFNRYPVGHPRAGEYLMGRPRFYVLVAKGQGGLFWDASQPDQCGVVGAKNEAGHARFRAEIVKWQYETTTSTGVEQKKPGRLFCDAMDEARYVAARFFTSKRRMTREDQIAARMAKEYPLLTEQAILAVGDVDRRAQRRLARELFETQVALEVDKANQIPGNRIARRRRF